MKQVSRISLVSILCLVISFATGPRIDAQQEAVRSEQPAAPIPQNELEGLVAPIALYPDELLSQILVASTYPLEIVQLAQWMKQNSDLKGQALVEAVKKQNWDSSIQAMVTFPDIVRQLSENIQWTTDLGNAFLAQQSDVMNAVQSLRMQAKNSGKLESSPQQTVETRVIENRTVVEIQPADPQVVYVPSYNPAVVWGAAAYPYPPVSYYPPASYVATGLISFGAGVALGAAWGHGGWGGWGWGANWGHNDININNNFVRNNNLNGSRTNIAGNRGNSTWRHNGQHRGGTPYPNRQTANRFGGSANRQQQARLANRQAAGNRQQRANLGGRQQGNLGGRQAGNRQANLGGRQAGNRQANLGGRQGNIGGGRQGNFGSGGNRSLARSDFGNAGNRIGNRQVQGSNFGNRSAFSGSRSGGFDRASSARGRSSLGSGGGRGGRSFGGGGGGRGGGGGGRRGGGGRGGGGRRR